VPPRGMVQAGPVGVGLGLVTVGLGLGLVTVGVGLGLVVVGVGLGLGWQCRCGQYDGRAPARWRGSP